MESVYPNLDIKVKTKNLSYSELARIIGISKYAMYRRISGKTEFKLSEAINICVALDEYDAKQLYLRLNTKT